MQDLDFAKAEGKEYYRTGLITSNEMRKRENRVAISLNFWTFFTMVSKHDTLMIFLCIFLMN